MMNEFIECAVKLRCTVLTKENHFLFVGQIVDYEAETGIMRLSDYARGEIPRSNITEGMALKLLIKLTRGRGELILIEGTITKSTSWYLLVQAQQAVIKEESRNNFRQNIMRPAVISHINAEPVEVPCVVLNISATGMALRAPKLFQIGDIVKLTGQRFWTRGPEHNVECRVVRLKGLPEGGYFYGCQFVNLTQEEENRLYQDIFASQAAEVSRQRGLLS